MVILIVFLVYIILLLLYGFYNKVTNRVCKSKRRLDGKTCLVTGGTSGIGLEIATDFAERGARVIIACPFESEGAAARQKIVENTGNENVVFKLLDLGSFESVRKFAADILASESRLDVLMNNAGVGMLRKMTKDGIDVIMQVNYFGTFLLTILLLPLLKKSGTASMPSRIVNTISTLHRLAKFDLENVKNVKDSLFKRILVYGNSKLCLILFSRELTKKLEGSNVVINDVDPGEVGTNIFYSCNYLLGCIFFYSLTYLAKNTWEGAQTPIFAAVDEKAGKMSGKFFRNCKLSSPSKKACDDEAASKLWHESIRLVKLTEEELKPLQF